MQIVIYKNGRPAFTHNFKSNELDNIKEICYNNNIKWYTISYTDKEYKEYEQFSKGHN